MIRNYLHRSLFVEGVAKRFPKMRVLFDELGMFSYIDIRAINVINGGHRHEFDFCWIFKCPVPPDDRFVVGFRVFVNMNSPPSEDRGKPFFIPLSGDSQIRRDPLKVVHPYRQLLKYRGDQGWVKDHRRYLNETWYGYLADRWGLEVIDVA